MSTTVQIGTEKVGTRVYVTGNTFAVKDRLKSAGCHWDGDRKQWWIGAAKQSAIAEIVGGLNGQEVKEDLSKCRVYAQVQYKGRKYYVIAEGQDKARLTVLDGSIVFWAAKADCELVKEYQSREVWDGRRNSGKTVTRYTTLGGIADFVKQRKEDDKTLKSGEIPDGWCLDHEDGCIKPRHECDMPAD